MILGFAGKAQAGKTTAAVALMNVRGYRRVSYASGVKEECAAFLERYGVCFKMINLYGDINDKQALLHFKDCRRVVTEIPEFLDFILVHSRGEIQPSIYFTARALMQWWGTDYRRKQDPDYWVKRAMERAMALNSEGYNVAIDDVRFPAEVECIQEAGGFVCYVIRGDRPVIEGSDHESETALDGYAGFDKYITNSSTVKHFVDKVCMWEEFVSNPIQGG